MRSFRIMIVVGLAVLVWSSCASQKNSSRTNDKAGNSQQPQIASNPGEPIPPGNCRVIATVVEIYPQLSQTDSGPYSKVPYLAKIQIDSVLGYGSAFPRPLDVKGTYTVKFNFTTRPSRELFPNLTQVPAEIKVGTRFQADITSSDSPQLGKQKATPQYIIYTYELK